MLITKDIKHEFPNTKEQFSLIECFVLNLDMDLVVNMNLHENNVT